MILLHEKYGITEKDFTRAELEIVPATPARDIGFDRSMVGGYGQDDRVDAYARPDGRDRGQGPRLHHHLRPGGQGRDRQLRHHRHGSTYTFDWLRQLCRMQGADDIRAFRASLCLSADVTAAYDPTWSSAFEPQNGTYAGRGVAFFKYTGSRGKSGANDASAEQMGYLTRMMDAAGVAWQIGELGPHRPGRRRHRGHRGSSQRHCRGGHRRAGAVHALALRGGQQERPVHGLPCLQHLYRRKTVNTRGERLRRAPLPLACPGAGALRQAGTTGGNHDKVDTFRQTGGRPLGGGGFGGGLRVFLCPGWGIPWLHRLPHAGHPLFPDDGDGGAAASRGCSTGWAGPCWP